MRLEGWARDGLTNEQFAANMGVTVKTFYEWQARFKELREAVKRGKAPVDIQVENALLKRALGFEYEEVTTEIEDIPTGKIGEDGKPIFKQRKHIKKTTKVVPPDTAAAFIWLKNRKPQQWRDKREVITDITDNAFKNIQTIAALINNPEPDVDIEDIAASANEGEAKADD